jgi:hypothetical protein
VSKLDITARPRSATECEGEISLDEVQALLIEAAELIEFLRPLLEPLENIRLKDLPPQGRA